MNRADLVEVLAAKHDLSKVAAGAFLETLIDTIQTAVKKGDTVQLVGFGSFKSAKACGTHRQEPVHRSCIEDSGIDRSEIRGWCKVQGCSRSQGCKAQGRQGRQVISLAPKAKQFKRPPRLEAFGGFCLLVPLSSVVADSYTMRP